MAGEAAVALGAADQVGQGVVHLGEDVAAGGGEVGVVDREPERGP